MLSRPPLGEALEWADTVADARRWQTVRYQVDCGWYTDDEPQRDSAGGCPPGPEKRPSMRDFKIRARNTPAREDWG